MKPNRKPTDGIERNRMEPDGTGATGGTEWNRMEPNETERNQLEPDKTNRIEPNVTE